MPNVNVMLIEITKLYRRIEANTISNATKGYLYYYEREHLDEVSIPFNKLSLFFHCLRRKIDTSENLDSLP